MPSQPGGNITGLASQYEDVVTEQVQLLAEAVQGLTDESEVPRVCGASLGSVLSGC